MSQNPVSTPFILNYENGTEVRLSKITPFDWITYTSRFRTNRKVKYTQTLRFSDVMGKKLIEKLGEFDARRIRHYDVMQWVTDLEGAAEMIALSICHGWEVWKDGAVVESFPPADRTTKDIPALLSALDYIDAAAGVAMLKLTTGEEKPDPKADSADNSTGTGGATQTESAPGSTPAATIP